MVGDGDGDGGGDGDGDAITFIDAWPHPGILTYTNTTFTPLSGKLHVAFFSSAPSSICRPRLALPSSKTFRIRNIHFVLKLQDREGQGTMLILVKL